MAHLVVIADVIASRQRSDRAALQQRLHESLDTLNRARPAGALLSPYTLTLGDELQVVPARAQGLFHDLLALSAALRPVPLRFALALGAIDTPINPRQAIGMDGSAFHRARDGIERLKKSGDRCRVEGLDGVVARLVNDGIALAFGRLEGTRGSRLPLAAGLLGGESIPDIAARLGKSEQTLYKTARAADLYALAGFLDAVEDLLDERLGPPTGAHPTAAAGAGA
jgi:hypothetical protein